MKRCVPSVVALVVVAAPLWGQRSPANESSVQAGPAGVSPGGSAGFELAAACPTFSWAAVSGARSYGLRAYRLAPNGEIEAASALAAELPAGASSWTPPADGCLVPGERYAWSVRAQTENGSTAWSEALLFEVTAVPSEAELQGAIEVLQRYLGTARIGEQTLGTAEADAPSTRSVAATEEPQPGQAIGGGPATAVRGEVPDGAGETYGVHGVSNSPDGAGVPADNNNAAGADLVLGGSPVAELTESSFSRDSAGNVTFNFTNPGAGTMTLQVDGSAVVTGIADDWVNETGDTMTGALAMSGNAITAVGDIALNAASTVTKAGSRFLWDDAGNNSFAAGRGALAANTTGTSDTALGTSALGANTTAYSNTAVGAYALLVNTTGNRNVAVGTGTLGANTTGGSNVALGRGALEDNTTAHFNTAVGAFALDANTTGTLNVALGADALGSNTTANYNTAVGANALFSNTTGFYNAALGTGALSLNTSGDSNVALGFRALAANTIGTRNVALGTDALGSNTYGYKNVALGRSALAANTSAPGNTAVGALALVLNTTGRLNVALGTEALGHNTTGDSNIAIGHRAGDGITGGDNNIFIGHTGFAGDTYKIRIGQDQTETFIDGIAGNPTSGGIAVFVNSSGELGTSTSSRRFKEDIADLGAVSERLLALRPVSLRYTKQAAGEGERPMEYGLIAEEVAEVLPELVAYDEEGAPYTVRYHLLVPLLLNELQREHGRVGRQEAQLAALLPRIEALERESRPAIAGDRSLGGVP